MEVLGTVVIIEHLTRLGKQSLDMFPYPLGPITDDTQAHLRFRNHAGLFDLLEGLAELLFVVHLMPTEHMDDALAIEPDRNESPWRHATAPATEHAGRACAFALHMASGHCQAV